jgi:hypothetical protein
MTDAGARAVPGNSRLDGIDNRLVTVTAGILGDAPVAVCDPKRIRISPSREVEGMPETVLRFCRVFADEVVRRVTVVAGSGPMTASLPGCEVLAHYVAIGARSGIIREIRSAFGIPKGENPKTGCKSERDRSGNREAPFGQAHRSPDRNYPARDPSIQAQSNPPYIPRM